MQFGGFGDIEESAEGCYVTTATGKRYLDFVGGFGVFSLGHRNPAVVSAAKAQLDRLPLSTKTFFNEKMAQLSAKLAEIAPGDLQYTFFSNSGAEAIEAAMKFARVASGKTDFVSTHGAYHGKTFGALSVTGREKYRTPFEPLLPGASFVPFNDLEAMRNAVTERTAAILIETVQGEGGIHVATTEYMQGLRKLCDERGALLIVDEVQTGLGRTGKMFGCEHHGVIPDIMTLAKALGGGILPIGATMATPAVWERVFGVNPLLHTSTFGGNPLACAAGLSAIEVTLSEDLIQNAEARGAQLLAGLRAIQAKLPEAILDVRGQGLIVGVEFPVQDIAEVTINILAGEGIIAAYTLNNPKVIRIEPPLIVSVEQCEIFLRAFATSVETAVGMLEGL
jgi:putrescine aminotransferase